ncbi:MAG: hypothetical protein WCG07_02750, partial [Candidatus Taylorbacteria bacterium]
MIYYTRIYKTLLIATVIYLSVHTTKVQAADVTGALDCTNPLTIADTRYILTATTTGNCVISANNIIIDGQGLYGIDGNVTSETQNIDLRNLNVTGHVQSNSSSGTAGNISIASSTVSGYV